MDDSQYKRLDAKLDKINDRIGRIDVTLAKQEVNLALHMKRSDALEAQVEPLKEHALMVAGVVKLFKIIGSVIAALGAIAALVEIFK